MDGRNRYAKVCELLKELVGSEISLVKLKRRIMIEIGCSEAVIIDTLHLMLNLGLIIEVSAGIYKVLRAEADI